jgi:hypothetical protein
LFGLGVWGLGFVVLGLLGCCCGGGFVLFLGCWFWCFVLGVCGGLVVWGVVVFVFGLLGWGF